MLALSLLSDAALWSACRRLGLPASRIMAVYASMWPVALFSSRALSNTLEMQWWTVMLWLLSRCIASHKDGTWQPSAGMHWWFAAAACWAGLGPSVRFTSVGLSLPALAVVGLALAWHSGERLIMRCLVLARMALTSVVLPVAAALAVGAVDARLFSGAWPTIARLLHPPPVLNAMYNADPANLALHGLHARWTHAVVFLPQLTAFAWPVAACMLAACCYRAGAAALAGRAVLLRDVGLAVVLGPSALFLAALSLAPHQEMRFLLPLLPAAAVAMAGGAQAMPCACPSPLHSRKAVWLVLWLAAQLAGLVGYGVLHQGGLVPALAAPLPGHGPGTLVCHSTYMPPRFLLAQPAPSAPAGWPQQHGRVPGWVLQLRHVLHTRAVDQAVQFGGHVHVLDTLGQHAQLQAVVSSACEQTPARAWLIMPASVNESVPVTHCQAFKPHVSLEALPRSTEEAALLRCQLICDALD